MMVFIPIFTVVGGFMEVTDKIQEWVSNVVEDVEQVGETNYTAKEYDVNGLLAKVPNYDSLSSTRKSILNAAAEVVAAGYPYNWGGHPSGPGLSGVPSTGLDCAGFVQYSLWTGTGSSPGYLTTGTISSKIGTDFIEIDCVHAKPGDIGLKRRGGSTEGSTNHTGIYAGNGLWFHAASKKTGIVMGTYSNFKICLRYKGVPEN